MKSLIRCFNVLMVTVSFVFCGQVLATPSLDSIDGSIDTQSGEWNSSEMTQTKVTDNSNINSFPSYRGNLHEEDGWNSGYGYDAKKLGLYISDGYLNIALQTTYDFTEDQIQTAGGSTRRTRDDEYINTGDFIFQLGDSETDQTVAAINSASNLSLDFSFDRYDNLDSLTFNWGTLINKIYADSSSSFDNAGLLNNADGTISYDVLSGDDEWGVYNVSVSDGREDIYSLELAISLASLNTKLQKLFASSTYAQMHWQMSCGNDVLYVADDYSYSTAHAPEPATFFLLGIGILGASFLERRRQEVQKKS